MLVEVTQDDIDKGEVGRCTVCPVSLAIKRILKPEYYAATTHFSIRIYDELTFYSVYKTETPGIVMLFISNFDQKTGLAKPFKFELDIPEELLK